MPLMNIKWITIFKCEHWQNIEQKNNRRELPKLDFCLNYYSQISMTMYKMTTSASVSTNGLWGYKPMGYDYEYYPYFACSRFMP